MRNLEEVLQGETHTKVTTMALMSFEFFCTRVLGLEFSNHHKAISMDWVNMKNNQCAHQLPRGHGKTTLASAYILWRMWREKEIRFLYVSGTVTQSKMVVAEVQHMMETNEFLKPLLPTDRSAQWSKEGLRTSNGNYFFIRSFSEKSRGPHVDYLFTDDVLRNEDYSIEQSVDLFWSVFYPMVQTRKGQCVILGTPISPEDLLCKLHESDVWTSKVLPAVTVDESGKWVDPLWPERFSIEDLRAIQKNQGVLIFEREFLLNPLASGAALFPESMVKPQIIDYLSNKPKPECNYYIGVDVALAAGKGADFSVFTILEKDEVNIVRMIRLERYKGKSIDWQLNRVKALHKEWNFRKIMVEERGLSKDMVLKAQDREVSPDICHIVLGFKTTRNNKEEILSRLQGGFTSHTLFIQSNSFLLRELSSFVLKKQRDGKYTYEGLRSHDDTVMSLAFAYEAAVGIQSGVISAVVLGVPESPDDQLTASSSVLGVDDVDSSGLVADTL